MKAPLDMRIRWIREAVGDLDSAQSTLSEFEDTDELRDRITEIMREVEAIGQGLREELSRAIKASEAL
jgi:hypothetical protein